MAKKLRVALFVLEDGPAVEGLTDGTTWNNWPVVKMTRTQAEALVQAYSFVYFDGDALVPDEDADEQEFVEPDQDGFYNLEGWTFWEVDEDEDED